MSAAISRRITSPNQRPCLYGTRDTLVFLLNGVIFILIGLQLPVIVGALKQANHTRAGLLAGGTLVTVAAILVRLSWVFSSTYLVLARFFKKLARAAIPPPPWREVFVVGWVGLRGIVSLAAALALPHGFPGRDYILFITFCVILGTLVFQGLTLPAVIRLLGLRGDDIDDREEVVARREATHAALARLEALSILGEATDEMIDRIRGRYKERLQVIEAFETAGASDEEARCVSDEQVRRQALTAEREMLILLRDDGTISDDVLRKVQHELDLDEARLSAESAD